MEQIEDLDVLENLEFDQDEIVDEINKQDEVIASSSSDTFNKIVDGMTGSGLPEDIILDLIKETDIEHRTSGIDGSYGGNIRSEEKINELLKDIDIPADIKAETISHENVLNVSNYSEFLLLQSRLTGVPFNALVSGLKIFEDEIVQKNKEEYAESEEAPTYEFEDDELVNPEPDIDFDLSENDEDLVSEEEGNVFVLEESEEEFDLGEDSVMINNQSTDQEQSVKAADVDLLEQEEQEEEIPEIQAADSENAFDFELEEEDIDIPVESTSRPDMAVDIELEEDIDSTDGFMDLSEEPLQVASPTAIRFNNANKDRVNKSRTYALYTLDAGGNYDV